MHRITREYDNVSFSDALRQLNNETSAYEINFLYNELEDFRVTTSIHRKTIPDAIRQMIGFYPIRMSIDSTEITVECVQKTTTRYDFDNAKWEDTTVKGNAGHVLRSRIQAEYDIPLCTWTPNASVELYNAWSVQKVRYTIGADWKINKKNSFSIYYRFQDNRGRFFLDNVLITSQPMGPDTIGPFVANVNPSENSLAVTFNEILDQSTAQNVTNYSINNGISVTAATLNGSVVTLAVSPALSEGGTYTLIVNNIADVAGNVMTADTVTFTYGVDAEFQVANIAALRAKWTSPLDVDGTHFGSEVYKLTGNVIVTGINNSYRHQIFIQDATGAIVIDDPSGKIVSALEAGDEITGLYGTLTDYYGLLQFAVTEEFSAPAISIYNDVTPLTVTVADMQDIDYMNAHQCELISMEGVSFNETGTFTNGTKYTLTANYGTGEGEVRTVAPDASVTTITDLGTGEYDPGTELCLFASHTTSVDTGLNNYGSWTFYSFKLYDVDDNLRCDLVPARRNSDGVLGLYDTVRDVFLTNSLAGTLTLGALGRGELTVDGGALTNLSKRYTDFYISYAFGITAIDWEDFRYVSAND